MLIEIEDRCVEIARPEKWVWYDQRLTMLDLATYFSAVWPWIAPHLRDRPIVYEIYPGTIKGPNSFEQDPPPRAPRWVQRVRIQGRERLVTYVVAHNAATLVYLVSLFMVSVHVWESTTRAIERPDMLLFDLDPPEQCSLARLARAALSVRDYLRDAGLKAPLVKTSGARGLHVIVPLRPRYDYATVRELMRGMCTDLERKHPDLLSGERDAQKRPAGTVHVDWGQLGRGMTIAAPYSPRACAGAPVSMPIMWEDVERFARSRAKRAPMETFAQFNLRTVPERLKEHGDAWAGAALHDLPRALISAR